MTYVINILQNLEAMTVDRNADRQKARSALADILNMERRRFIRNLCGIFYISDLNGGILSAIENEGLSDFEDALQEECAVEIMADYIVTRNLRDYERSRIKVIEPDEFARLLKDDY